MMKIVKPSVEFLWMTPYPLTAIERAGRTCYKSEQNIKEASASKFAHMILNNGHEAMIEHASMSYCVTCDRGVSHEIVRHRLFSFAQESTRYCDYNSKGISFIEPHGLFKSEDEDQADSYSSWISAMRIAESSYYQLRELGCKPEIARSVLPNSLKTEIVITGNFREWRHFFKLRTDKKAHPQMREIANMILEDAIPRVPIVFDEYTGRS
jgi:thymidylate synthase (FAD)